MKTKIALESVVLNHLKYVLNYRQVRSDKKVEVFKEISFDYLKKQLHDYETVRNNVAKGVNDILNSIRDRIEDFLPDLKYDLEKTAWANSILFSFTLTPKLLLEYDHSSLIKYLTLIDKELDKIPQKIKKLFSDLNKIAENKKDLEKLLIQHGFRRVYDEFDTIYSKRLKLIGEEESAKILENYLKNYEILNISFDKTERYFTVDIKITGKELIDELEEFLEILDQFFEEYRATYQQNRKG